MAYYEVVYETGAHSIITGDEDAVMEGLKEQQRRAVSGEDGGPAGHAAERIKRVLKYDEHPADYNMTQTMSGTKLLDELTDRIGALSSNQGGEVSLPQVAQELVQIGSPLKPDSGDRHDSLYKAPEAEELSPTLWGGEA